jgi:hypothetical protein
MEMAVSMVEARRRKQAAPGGAPPSGDGTVSFSASQLAERTGAAV